MASVDEIRVKPHQLNDAILKQLNRATDDYRRYIQDVAETSASYMLGELQRNIRAEGIKGTKYYRSVRYDVNINRVKTTVILYSGKHYRLTHLLENGHAIVKREKTVGHTAARPHWRPAEIAGIKYFTAAIQHYKG